MVNFFLHRLAWMNRRVARHESLIIHGVGNLQIVNVLHDLLSTMKPNVGFLIEKKEM